MKSHVAGWPALLAFTGLVLAAGEARSADKAPRRPNILAILVDDMGFSDLGCYGSEIPTPTMDRLAAGGVRFTQFYNTAKCHSSRVCLMSGRWCEQAGNTSLKRSVTVAEVLRSSGYFTAMTGKWHLDGSPLDFGFDRYWGHLSGASDYFIGNDTFRLDRESWEVPPSGFYTTTANADFALQFLDQGRRSGKPWFLYMAFNAPHAPLQAPAEDYRRHLGKYAEGWDVVRARRAARQKEIGLLDKDLKVSPRPDHIPAWDSLGEDWHEWEGKRMAAYAAMIDRLDREIGRVVGAIEKAGELDNTVILFFSDNGACPYDRRNEGRDLEPVPGGGHWSDSTGWAWARNTPFRYYKQNQFEGGISSPAIIHWPGGLRRKPGSLIETPAHLVDVLPTLAELAGAPIPESWPGREPTPLAGVSLAPLLANKPLEKRPPIFLLFSSDRALRDGDWKLASFQSEPWELYNIAEDRTELNNLAAKYPERAKEMAEQWSRMAEEYQVPANKRDPVAETAAGKQHREWTKYDAPSDAAQKRRAEQRQQKHAGTEKTAGKEKAGGAPGIRGRKDTKLRYEESLLILDCGEGDPGLAFDALPDCPAPGPYTLAFRMRSDAGGSGEVYWTTEAGTQLTKGGHAVFEFEHDDQWREGSVVIGEPKPLKALRFDPCEDAGTVQIEKLELRAAGGEILKLWPR
jgi:arylsulfatase A-like enzyme